ncbi:aldehyde dehydrogenase family protein [Enterobacter sp. Ap-1006]|uniref:aldehyde dehydrogenase family protein n=1 Tax=Enterobacter sp. Ap-1006 TaxID=2608345 RepID=UPI0014201E6C|nr:aldehyde dehydrogenase family protein [Enterobacter sp. Ap-1006]NIF46259.1 aldehyde dehydrogenase family protein [Enterobacter sp. Ap-1006]
MKFITQHYINGRFTDSRGKQTMVVVNPSTKEPIAQLTLGNEQDVREAIEAANVAFPSFSRSSVEERAEYLQRLHDAILARESEHVAVRTLEYGSPPLHNKYSIQGAAKLLLNMKRTLLSYEFSQPVGAARVTMKPVGVCGLIAPWNAVLFTVCNKLAPAIAAGCTSVIKISEFSPLQSQLLAECIDAAGLPPGVVNLVHGLGSVAGAELAKSPHVAKISFTGSTLTGRVIMRHAAETFKRLTLELGGKSPHIVLDDADLDKAAQFAIEAAFRNNGQACIAGSRLLVAEHQFEAMKQALLRALPEWKVGLPEAAETRLGPLVNEQQFQKVQGYIAHGIKEGAVLLAGGEGSPEGLEGGWFTRPTIFVNVNNQMKIAREEIFGPVLCVLTYRSEEEAIHIANDTTYGLMGWVSCGDTARGQRVADAIQAGIVMVNKTFDLLDEAGIPAGGCKQSGLGREMGVQGLEAYLEAQSLFS